ncbi:MAG TPA: hypothetical protein P5543_08520 [Planctomycetota bacterium]|nr:hypothetical protein [Planctomycetota bacterium]HRU52221.1 hypothetical protein [Planctomycetota bacterium]
MNNRQHGKTNFVFILLIILLLCLLGSGTYLAKKQKTVIRSTDNAQTQYAREYQQYKKTIANISKLSNLIGFYPKEQKNTTKCADIRYIIKQLDRFCSDANQYGSKRALGLNIDSFKIDKNDALERNEPYDIANLQDPAMLQKLVNLQQVLNACYERIRSLKHTVEKNKEKLAAVEANYLAQIEDTKKSIEDIHTAIQEKHTQLEEMKREQERKVEIAEKERDEAQASKVKEKNEVLALHRQKSAEKIKYEMEIENLDERIQELRAEAAGQTGMEKWLSKDKQAKSLQDQPDGEIIYIDDQTQTAYIDLGKGDGVLKGMNFEVFQYGKGGVKITKAKIIVKEVHDKMSKVGVINLVDPLNPVKASDKIINPVFDRNKVKYFVIAGSLSQKYSLDQVSHIMETLGGRIEKEITARTDIVVLCDGFKRDEIYKLAQERGIETMLESEFIDYISE